MARAAIITGASRGIGKHAVDAVATELGVASPSADQMYLPAL